MSDYVISKASSIVTDKKGRIRFAGTDTEAIQWAIDKIDADNKKWHNRLLRWLRLGRRPIVNLDAPVFTVTDTINLASHMELRGTRTKKVKNNE